MTEAGVPRVIENSASVIAQSTAPAQAAPAQTATTAESAAQAEARVAGQVDPRASSALRPSVTDANTLIVRVHADDASPTSGSKATTSHSSISVHRDGNTVTIKIDGPVDSAALVDALHKAGVRDNTSVFINGDGVKPIQIRGFPNGPAMTFSETPNLRVRTLTQFQPIPSIGKLRAQVLELSGRPRVDLLDALSRNGYQHPSVDELIQLGDHGVTGEFVDQIVPALGSRPTLRQLMTLSEEGVGASYVRGMATAGYAHLSIEQLVRLHESGVTPQFVKHLSDHGYRNLTIDQLMKLAESGI